MSRVGDVGLQTEDDFDDALLKEIGVIGVEEDGVVDDVDTEHEDGDGDGVDGMEILEEDIAAAKVLDAAADDAYAYAAAAFADVRCNEMKKC